MSTTMAPPSAGEATYPTFSRAIWGDLSRNAFIPSPIVPTQESSNYASGLFDDFIGFGKTTAVSSNIGRYRGRAGMYYSYEDSGNTITSLATVPFGNCAIATDSTDNDQCSMQVGEVTHAPFVFENTASAAGCKAFWMEHIFSVSQVASGNYFLGLAEEGATVHDFIADDATFADVDYMGFHVIESAATTIAFRFHKAGQTAVTVHATVGTLAASTLTKLGMKYVPIGSPGYDANKVIRLFLNGAELATYGTATQLAAATFPAGEEMSPIWCVKNGAGTASVLTLRRWAAAQKMPIT